MKYFFEELINVFLLNDKDLFYHIWDHLCENEQFLVKLLTKLNYNFNVYKKMVDYKRLVNHFAVIQELNKNKFAD